MLLKFNKNTELEILGIGTFIPGQFVVTDDEARAKKYLDSGYFEIIKEKKKRKKSKKKGVDK